MAEAPDTTYYSARELDIYPALTEALGLRYPDRALADGVRGRALVELHISDMGIVQRVAIVETEPQGYFEAELRATFLATRFTPGIRDGRSVRSVVRVRVDYGAESAPP